MTSNSLKEETDPHTRVSNDGVLMVEPDVPMDIKVIDDFLTEWAPSDEPTRTPSRFKRGRSGSLVARFSQADYREMKLEHLRQSFDLYIKYDEATTKKRHEALCMIAADLKKNKGKSKYYKHLSERKAKRELATPKVERKKRSQKKTQSVTNIPKVKYPVELVSVKPGELKPEEYEELLRQKEAEDTADAVFTAVPQNTAIRFPIETQLPNDDVGSQE